MLRYPICDNTSSTAYPRLTEAPSYSADIWSYLLNLLNLGYASVLAHALLSLAREIILVADWHVVAVPTSAGGDNIAIESGGRSERTSNEDSVSLGPE